jgi:putative effector of murein hydrolase
MLNDWYSSPPFGAGLTILAYAIGLALNRRVQWLPILVITCGLLIIFLEVFNVPNESYQKGAAYVSILLSPAIVALSVPFVENVRKVGHHLWTVVISVFVGSVAGLLFATMVVRELGLPPEIRMSIVAPCATAPIGMDLVKEIKGIPSLAALSSVFCGLTGSLFGPWLLRLCGFRKPEVLGTAIGAGSHGIGTARLLRESDLLGAYGGLALALAGVIMTLLFAVFHTYLISL